jgi:hypothetical protein
MGSQNLGRLDRLNQSAADVFAGFLIERDYIFH